MGLRYDGKVVLITGGSCGIGEGCVRLFVEHGAKVTFCSFAQEEGDALAAEVNAKGPGQCEFVFAECTKEEDIKNVVDRCLSKWGTLDCLINNVGRSPTPRTIDDYSSDDLRALMDLNAISYFLFSKFCLPTLRKTKGNIVNISNLTPKTGMSKTVIYAMTKGATSGLSKALAVDEAEFGVRVNCILPGAVDTPLARGFCTGTGPGAMEQFLDGLADLHHLGKLCTTREVAEAALFLAAEGTFCTGVELHVSGGMELGFAKKAKRAKSGEESLY